METEVEYKYHCDVCNYHCIYPSHWQQHIESVKHKNEGKRKERCDKKLEPKCKVCDYTTNRTTNMKLHYLNNHADKEERKKEFKYYCEECDFGHFTKGLYDLHMNVKHS
jgi:Zinc-finger of C2H2 type